MFASENMFAPPHSDTSPFDFPLTAGSVTEDVDMDGVQDCQICQDEIDRQVGARLRAAFPDININSMLGTQQQYTSVEAGPLTEDIVSFSDISSDFPENNLEWEYISAECSDGLALTDDEMEDVPSELAENMALVLTDLWKNGLPAEFDQDELSTNPTSVRSDQWLLDALKEAMSYENLCQDLLHYQWAPEVSPEYPADRIHYLLGQYSCAHRILVIAHRWSSSNMKMADWMKEMTLLIKASDEVDNKMTLWPQMDAVFTRFQDETRMNDCLTAADRSKDQVKTRRTLVRDMKTLGKGLIDGIEMELGDMLPKDIPVLALREAVKKEVADDSEKFGSLRLGSVPTFTESTRSEMTHSWSWTD